MGMLHFTVLEGEGRSELGSKEHTTTMDTSSQDVQNDTCGEVSPPVHESAKKCKKKALSIAVQYGKASKKWPSEKWLKLKNVHKDIEVVRKILTSSAFQVFVKGETTY